MRSRVSTALITVYRTPREAYGDGDLSGGAAVTVKAPLLGAGGDLWQPAASWAPGPASRCFCVLKEAASPVNLIQHAEITKIPELL